MQTLVVPADGLVPGYECGRCGALSLRGRRLLPGLGTAALAVPDVIEEMVSRVLEDGGEVVVTGDGSFPVAAGLAPCRRTRARERPRPAGRGRPVVRTDGNLYLAGLISIFLTSSFFSALRPTETVRMPWS